MRIAFDIPDEYLLCFAESRGYRAKLRTDNGKDVDNPQSPEEYLTDSYVRDWQQAVITRKGQAAAEEARKLAIEVTTKSLADA